MKKQILILNFNIKILIFNITDVKIEKYADCKRYVLFLKTFEQW